MTDEQSILPAPVPADSPEPDPRVADHGFDPVVTDGLTYPLGDFEPGTGEYFELMPGIGWTRTPVPGPLGHINNWILDDVHPDGEPGFAIVDTGLFIPKSIAAWKSLFEEGALQGKRATRIVVTHYHPDHSGCAGWLANRFKAPLSMNRTEWMLVGLHSSSGQQMADAMVEQGRLAGWTEEQCRHFLTLFGPAVGKVVSDLPLYFDHLSDGQTLRIGKREWQVMVGHGHTPEHCCLIDHDAKVMIAGDQILPRITSNISIIPTEPMSNPLQDWLDSIAHFRNALDPDIMLLPAHGRPFVGAHLRLDALARRHHDSLAALEARLAERPLRIVDMFPSLFDRPIDDNVLVMATGEAYAHVRYLEAKDRVRREVRDGVTWFRAA